MTMKTANLIKLAASNPKARKALIPLIIKSANLKNKEVVKGLVKIAVLNPEYAELFRDRIAKGPSYRDYVEKKRKQGEKPLSEKDWETKVKGKGDEDKKDKKEPAKKQDDKWESVVEERRDVLREKLPEDLKQYPPGTSVEDLEPEHREELEGYNLAVVGKDAAQAINIARQLKEGIDKSADICKLAPPVCQGNKGLSRDKMPQIEGGLSVKQMSRSDEERIKDATFKHPTEGKKVKFDELPEAEQKKLKKEWAEERAKAKAMVEAGADPDEDRTTLQQLLDHVKDVADIGTTDTQIAVGRLRATQKEIKAAKTFGMADAHLKGKFDHIGDSVVVSRDGYILDGHHRWAALMTIDPSRKMKVKVVDMDMDDLLAEAASFPGVYRASFSGEPLDKENQEAYKKENKSKLKKSKKASDDSSLEDRIDSFWEDLELALKKAWPTGKLMPRGEYRWSVTLKIDGSPVHYDIDGDEDGNFEVSVLRFDANKAVIGGEHRMHLKPTIKGLIDGVNRMSAKMMEKRLASGDILKAAMKLAKKNPEFRKAILKAASGVPSFTKLRDGSWGG
jgi:hypothetical protein